MPRTEDEPKPDPADATPTPEPGPLLEPDAGQAPPVAQDHAVGVLREFTQAPPVVNVHVPAASVLVDEYYELAFEREVIHSDGRLARVIKGTDPIGRDDRIERYDREQGTSLHVRSTAARVTFADGEGEHGATAQPLDGRKALRHAPGVRGGFGFPGAARPAPKADAPH
jgi:hypothetical protein